MAKLLSQQLKENIKDVSPWMIIPIILTILLNRINGYFDSQILELVLVLSTFVMYSSFAIALVIVILNDYKRFYGEGASFYDVLPIKDRDITISRFLNYLIMAILAGFILIVELLVFFVLVTSLGVEGLKEIFETIKNILIQLPNLSIFLSFLAVITSIIANLVKFMAAITIGSDKAFKGVGKFGPVIAYIIITIVISLLGFIIGTYFLVDLNTSQLAAQNAAEVGGFVIEVSKKIKDVSFILGVGSVFNILTIGVLSFLTNYFHKNRLTVA